MPSSASNTSSAFSRTSPNVHFTHPSHRSGSPSQPANLTRGSPLHLSHHPATSSSSSASIPSSTAQNTGTHSNISGLPIVFIDSINQIFYYYVFSLHIFLGIFKRQSSHMTPPPPSSSSLLSSSPLSKLYGPQTPTPQQAIPQPPQQTTPQPRSMQHNSTFSFGLANGNGNINLLFLFLKVHQLHQHRRHHIICGQAHRHQFCGIRSQYRCQCRIRLVSQVLSHRQCLAFHLHMVNKFL